METGERTTDSNNTPIDGVCHVYLGPLGGSLVMSCQRQNEQNTSCSSTVPTLSTTDTPVSQGRYRLRHTLRLGYTRWYTSRLHLLSVTVLKLCLDANLHSPPPPPPPIPSPQVVVHCEQAGYVVCICYVYLQIAAAVNISNREDTQHVVGGRLQNVCVWGGEGKEGKVRGMKLFPRSCSYLGGGEL